MGIRTESLYFRQNLQTSTIEKMRQYRKATIELSKMLESFGESRELSLAFTHLEAAQMYANKALCLLDTEAVKEALED